MFEILQLGADGSPRFPATEADALLGLFPSPFRVPAARDIFRRAALYITLWGTGVSHTIFMPPNATLLELRHESLAPADVAQVLLGASLVEACKVRHFVVYCGDDGNQMACQRNAVLDVIDRAAHDAYTAPTQTESALVPPQYGKSLARLNSWMSCVNTKGKWVYSAKPRLLPWFAKGGGRSVVAQ